MKLSCRNYEKRRCWTRAGNIKRLAHNHMSLQSSNTVWKSHVKMINTHSEAGVNLEALYRPLQDTWSKPARLFRLCVSPRKILALLYTVMMMMQKHLEKKKNITKNQSWTSGSFFLKSSLYCLSIKRWKQTWQPCCLYVQSEKPAKQGEL